MSETQPLLSHFYVAVEGLDGPAGLELEADLLEVTVESSLHLPDLATLVLHDSRLRWADEPKLEPGKPLRISARSDRDEHPLFDGEIVELEPEFTPGAQRLTVRAFDRLHRLARGRRVRSFLNVTDGDLVQKIAAELGLRAQVDGTTQVHPYVFQANETNLEFLQGRAAALGYVLYADGQTIHFAKPQAEGSPRELAWGQRLLEFRPRITTVDQMADFTVRGWDPAQRQEIVGRVQNGNGTPAVGERRKGGELASQAFGLEASHLTADRPIRTQAEADLLAQAMADRHASRFIEADGVCMGDSSILAASSITLTGLGDRFSGTYVVTTVRHSYAAEQGYTTAFTVSGLHPATLLSLLAPERAPIPTTGLVVGIVTNNDDPDGAARVKVKFPWLTPDHESGWARVVSVGAGPERGVQFLPEVNDEVLVGFEQGDIHHPYVLGGLWNGQDRPPLDQGEAVSGGKVQRRVIRSRSGHKITLDDSDGGGGVTVEDKKGNKVFLDAAGNAMQLKVQGDMTLEAQGNLTLKAQGRVEITGTGVQVDGGGGTVDVKGSLINLN